MEAFAYVLACPVWRIVRLFYRCFLEMSHRFLDESAVKFHREKQVCRH